MRKGETINEQQLRHQSRAGHDERDRGMFETVKISRTACVAFAALLLVAGSGFWYRRDGGTPRPVVMTSSPAPLPRSPMAEDSQVTETIQPVAPANSAKPHDDSLPNKLHAMVVQLRASGNARQIAWADAIELAWTDFEAACRLLAKDYPSELVEKREFLLILIGSEDWRKGLAGVDLVDDFRSRKSIVSALVYHWSRTDVSALLAFAEHLEGGERTMALERAIQPLLAAGRFSDAEDTMRKMPPSNERKIAVQEIARARGRKDPHEALLWAASLENPDEEREAVRYAMSEAIPAWSVDELLQLADTSTQPGVKQMCISAAAAKLAASDVNAGLAWAEKLPTDLKSIAKRRIARELARTDPARATSLALELPAPDQLLDEVQRQLIGQGPERVIAWMNTLPEEYQEREADGLVRHWYRIDPEKVSSWTNQLPLGRVRDRALAALAGSISEKDVSSAREVALQIANDRLRNAILDTLK
jgi:hypothetical protein